MAFLVRDVGMDRQLGVEQDARDLVVRGVCADERARDGADGFGAVAVVLIGPRPFPDQAPRPCGQLVADLGRQVVEGQQLDIVAEVGPLAFLRPVASTRPKSPGS